MPVNDPKEIFDLFVAERAAIEQNSGFTFPKLMVATSGGHKAFTIACQADYAIAFLPPFFRAEQVRFAAGHELGHVLHLMAGLSFDSYEDQEEFCDAFALEYGSEEARRGNFTQTQDVSERNRRRFQAAIEKLTGSLVAKPATPGGGNAGPIRHGAATVL